MKTYKPNEIKNIALVGSAGSRQNHVSGSYDVRGRGHPAQR